MRVMLLSLRTQALKSASLSPKTQTVSVYTRHPADCSKQGEPHGGGASVRGTSTFCGTARTRQSQRRHALGIRQNDRPRRSGRVFAASRVALGHCGLGRQRKAHTNHPSTELGEANARCLVDGSRHRERPAIPMCLSRRQTLGPRHLRQDGLARGQEDRPQL
jgi:hypothetical protein